MTSIPSTGSRFPSVQKYDGGLLVAQRAGSPPAQIKIEGEELVKAKGIKVKKIDLNADDLKFIKIKFEKGQDGKLYIEFTENNKSPGAWSNHRWEIGNNVKEFRICTIRGKKDGFIKEITLTIVYKDKTPDNTKRLYSVSDFPIF